MGLRIPLLSSKRYLPSFPFGRGYMEIEGKDNGSMFIWAEFVTDKDPLHLK
jgi:hypothetical protein